MLIRLSQEQIGENWDIIRAAIRSSAMPSADTNRDKMNNILKSLLIGRAVCWLDGNKDQPTTLVITSITIEEISGTKNLLIYCAHGFRQATSEDYVKMISTIGRYAKSVKCDNVIAYIWNPRILELLRKYGAEANYTLVVFPLS